jgi:Na+-translocating ferredoxin:NAD+ oxidoreductase RnfC subunit
MVRTAKGSATISPQMVLAASLCCGCGICESLACCQGISPKAVINEYKAILAKNKLRFVSKEDSVVAPEREYRMVPSERWEHILGIAKFDKVAKYIGEQKDFRRAEIYLRQHIGAPSVAIVKEGDVVKKGDKIAESADGLSLPQYASVSGRVMLVEGVKIIIEKDNV